jgi:hypothetical protein
MSQLNAAQIIAAWRAAQRRLESLEPGTPEHASVTAEVEGLRRDYHDALETMRARETKRRSR